MRTNEAKPLETRVYLESTWKQEQVIGNRFLHTIHCASSWSESESKKAESIWADRTGLRSRGTDPWTYLGVKETLWFPPYSAQATLLKACGKNLETKVGDWTQISAHNSLCILLVRVWVQESRIDLGRQTGLRSRGTDPWTYLGVKETLWFPPYSAQATLLKACGKNLETKVGDWTQISAHNSLCILLVRVWVQESRIDLGRQDRPQKSRYRSMNISWGEGNTVIPTIFSTGDLAEGMRKEPGNKSRWLNTDFCTQFTVHPLGQSLSPRKQNRSGQTGQASEVAVQIHEHILGWRKHCDSHHIQHNISWHWPCWRHAERTWKQEQVIEHRSMNRAQAEQHCRWRWSTAPLRRGIFSGSLAQDGRACVLLQRIGNCDWGCSSARNPFHKMLQTCCRFSQLLDTVGEEADLALARCWLVANLCTIPAEQ